jgi:hypothetical protein
MIMFCKISCVFYGFCVCLIVATGGGTGLQQQQQQQLLDIDVR